MSTTTQTPVVKATAKSVRISPRKVGEVVALVRGCTVDDALVILDHTPRRAAQEVAKAIKSAAANATNNHGYKEDGLYIEEIFVTAGMRIKRYRPAAHGRALPYQKKTSHIHVRVSGTIKPAKKPAAKKTTKKEEDK